MEQHERLDDAARGAAELERTVARARGTLEEFVRGVEHGSANMKAAWARAMDDMLVALGRWLDGLGGVAEGASGGVGAWGYAFGSLVGMALGHGPAPGVTLAHPHVDRPPGAILPGSLPTFTDARAPAAVTLAEGAVQIHAQTLDDATLARAADLLAQEIHARLAFEDRRVGRT